MLFDATQDWWTGTAPSFQIPGLVYESYGRPLIQILPVLYTVLLLLPLFRALRWTLADRDSSPTTPPVSIIDLLSWTALAALIFVWIRFLNSDLAPRTGYSFSSLSTNVRETMLLMILSMIPAAVLLAQLFAWQRHWSLAIGVLFAGWAVDSLATGFATHAINVLTGTSFGILSGDSLDRWCFTGGRSLLAFSFGGFALLLGIQIRRPQQETKTVP